MPLLRDLYTFPNQKKNIKIHFRDFPKQIDVQNSKLVLHNRRITFKKKYFQLTVTDRLIVRGLVTGPEAQGADRPVIRNDLT
jgi:hypothetical protein